LGEGFEAVSGQGPDERMGLEEVDLHDRIALGHQILMNARGRQPGGQRARDRRQKLAAEADATGRAPGGRNGRFCRLSLGGPGGRNGWFWPRRRLRPGGRNGQFCPCQVTAHRLAVDAKLTSDAPTRPPAGMKHLDRLLQVHFEDTSVQLLLLWVQSAPQRWYTLNRPRWYTLTDR
jgi:hypothetical protein